MLDTTIHHLSFIDTPLFITSFECLYIVPVNEDVYSSFVPDTVI